jgi:hypothetical protein
MVPGEKDQPTAVWGQPRRGVEVVAARKNASGLIAVDQIDGDNCIDRLALARMVLAHADPVITATVDDAIRETPVALAGGRRRRKRLRLGLSLLLLIETTVAKIREINASPYDRP